ncbi:unnamed protein product [Spirodela intermedia]|uniref:Uncharacterized protein n=1 Tax=Spirodela intermedia TaxID=51605 RepID=A0A7I8J551_SPIIN|nr:unnamed protein product [Spirodela intermedia]CAA6665357.1 unnamed protein product [Spirodela intermedia]
MNGPLGVLGFLLPKPRFIRFPCLRSVEVSPALPWRTKPSLRWVPRRRQDEAAAAAAEQQQEEGEIEKLRSERFHLRSDLDAAVAQADMLRAACRSSGDEGLAGRRWRIWRGRYRPWRRRRRRRPRGGGGTADAGGCRGAGGGAGRGRLAAAARSCHGDVGGEEALRRQSYGERQAEAKILVFEGKVKSFQSETERVSSERESELHRMKVAISELEEKAGFYELKLLKLRELENGDEDDDADGAVHTLAKGPEASHTNFPWKILVGSTATIAGVTVVTFLCTMRGKGGDFVPWGCFDLPCFFLLPCLLGFVLKKSFFEIFCRST